MRKVKLSQKMVKHLDRANNNLIEWRYELSRTHHFIPGNSRAHLVLRFNDRSVLVGVDSNLISGLFRMKEVPESDELYLPGPVVAYEKWEWEVFLSYWLPDPLIIGRVMLSPSAIMKAVQL